MVAVRHALMLTHLSVASCWALGQPTSLRAAGATSTHHSRLPSATMSMGDPGGALTLLGGALARSDSAESSRDWQRVGNQWLRLPASTPWAVVHFVGGAGLGSAPQLCYNSLWADVCDRANVAVIATPYDVAPDHARLAAECMAGFESARAEACELGLLPAAAPVFRAGHSLGAKLLVVEASWPTLTPTLTHSQLTTLNLHPNPCGNAAGMPRGWRGGRRSLHRLRAAARAARPPRVQQLRRGRLGAPREQRGTDDAGRRRAGGAARSKCPLGSAPARLLHLLRTRLAALGSSALPVRGRPTWRPATTSGARASRLQSRRSTACDHVGGADGLRDRRRLRIRAANGRGERLQPGVLALALRAPGAGGDLLLRPFDAPLSLRDERRAG